MQKQLVNYISIGRAVARQGVCFCIAFAIKVGGKKYIYPCSGYNASWVCEFKLVSLQKQGENKKQPPVALSSIRSSDIEIWNHPCE